VLFVIGKSASDDECNAQLLIKAGLIKSYFSMKVRAINIRGVVIEHGIYVQQIQAQQVFALIGYHPDYSFIESLGVTLDPDTRKPQLNSTTLESKFKGIYLAGVMVGGNFTNEIFIEHGRTHAKQIVETLNA
jgi:thioredoxin reductase (NADPH)